MQVATLQNLSSFTLLDSPTKVPDLIETAKKRGYQAVGLADVNVTYGLVNFYELAKKAGIKPLLGMRRGEACGLRWSDISWKKRSIHIQRNVVKLSHEPIFVKPPKTASGNRVVYISKGMAKLLKSWKQQCTWERKQNDEVLQEDDYLFRQPNGDPMVPTTFTFRFKKILRQNGLPENLNVHSLRHTNASLLIAQGVDVRTVASLLGHSQASTTLDIYAHAFDKKKREAQEKLGEVMGL